MSTNTSHQIFKRKEIKEKKKTDEMKKGKKISNLLNLQGVRCNYELSQIAANVVTGWVEKKKKLETD